VSSYLITGATGFLGRALVRELLQRKDANRICIYSRDEAKQAAMRAQLPDPEERLHWFVGDVRDLPRLRRAMAGVNVVIHAAALKRVEVGEYNPAEMVKTNVIGTMNVIEAAFDAPCGLAPAPRRVVYVSSDKACQPLNAYGASKLMGEKLVLASNNARGREGPIFSACRYGNVAGSTGSVIPAWRAALKEGKGAAWITDPQATRFWMTIDHAVDLVLGAAESGIPGSLITAELPAYRLADLARAMNMPRPMRLVGLGKGEKLHERMLEDGYDSSQVRRMTIDELREGLAKL
jgi:UDP-N-acetylglucosamine 4,6-dehydratase